MFSLWREKTGSKTPREWSAIHRTPILCLIPKNLYDDAKKAFEVLNRTTATEKEIESALAFLEGADFYADLTEPEKVDQAFAKMLSLQFSVKSNKLYRITRLSVIVHLFL